MDLIQFLQLTCVVAGLFFLYGLYLMWQEKHNSAI